MENGRLTLEHWLTPRLESDGISRRPGTEVIELSAARDRKVDVMLSDSSRLAVDRVVLACGYRANLASVPYLQGVVERVGIADSYPVLDEHFQTTL